eukprot:6173714-Pleurochrysis_carterae.AAC.1
MGGKIAGEPCPTEDRIAVYYPCDISSSLRPNFQPQILIVLAVRFRWIRGIAISFMAIHMGHANGEEKDAHGQCTNDRARSHKKSIAKELLCADKEKHVTCNAGDMAFRDFWMHSNENKSNNGAQAH